MPNLKPISLVIAVLLPILISAQISTYSHIPTIMGQQIIKISSDSTLELKPEMLVIHEMDEADLSTYQLTVKDGSNYTRSENKITPTDDFQGNLYVNVQVSDGEFESNEFTINIDVNSNDNELSYQLVGQDSVRILKNSRFELTHKRFEFGILPLKKNVTFYVAPDGDNTNPGTLEQPLQTLNGARLKVRSYKDSNGLPQNGITVYFREGDYFMSNTVNFDSGDSGAKGQPITYRSYPNEKVRFTGAKKVNWSWFENAPASITNKIKDSNARSKIKMVDLKSRGITQYGEIGHVGYVVSNQPISPCNIYIDGKAMHLCRYPNSENFSDIKSASGKNQFTSESGVVNTWENTGDLWIDGALSKAWEWKKNKIQSISAQGVVKTVYDYHNDITTQHPKMFYFNMIEELDYPEEYFLDRSNGILYFYPPEGITENTEIKISQSTSKLISIKSTNYLEFKDLAFEGTRNSAINASNGASFNHFENCEIYACGLDGIWINGSKNTIINSHIHDTGANGVYLNGGVESTLTPALNLIENCKINDFSQERKVYNPGLTLFGIGQVVRHMELYNGPHMAIKIKGNNHIIEYSDLHRAPHEYSDMLAVYFNTGNFPLMRGTIIRKNKFHDVNGSWKQSPGVYMDNETCGVLVEENYFYNNIAESSGWSVMIHGGADNIVRKNVFVHCSYPFCISLRLNGYASGDFEGRLDRWQTEFKNKATDAYFTNYPELKHFFDDEGVTPNPQTYTYNKKKDSQGNVTNYWDRRTPSTNVFKDNIVYNESPSVFAMPSDNRGFYTVSNFRVKNGSTQENLISSNNHNANTNPGFVDYAQRDLTFSPDKIIGYYNGALPHLTAMPFHEMGLYAPVGIQHKDFKLDKNKVQIQILENNDDNYSVENNEIIPKPDFTGQLTIPIKMKIGNEWESDTFLFKLNVVDEFKTGMKPFNSDNQDIQLFPNPATQLVSIKGIKGDAKFRIISTSGSILTQSSTPNIDVSHLTPGTYFVRVDQMEKTYLKRFIKI